MSFYKIASSGNRGHTDHEIRVSSIDDKIQQLLSLKQQKADLERRKTEINRNTTYIEGLEKEPPSDDWKILHRERSSVVEQLNGNKGKGIVGLNQKYKHLSDGLAHELSVLERGVFKWLGKMEDLDNELATDINCSLTKFKDFYRKALGNEIRKLFDIPTTLPLHIELKDGGKSDGFKVRFNGTTIYVKESVSYLQDHGVTHARINPKELFIYKVLERCHLGPKTKFIVQPYSSGRSGARLCFICTQDVSHTKRPDQKSKEFILDNMDRSSVGDSEGLDIWKMALQDAAFCSELLCLSMLDDVLLLQDTFAANAANYGVVKVQNRETGEIRYKPKLIDHLPYSQVAESNGQKFKYDSLGDAINSLRDKVAENKRNKEARKSPNVTALGNLVSQAQDTLLSSAQQAMQRLIGGKQGKERSGVREAIEDAYTETVKMITVAATRDAYAENSEALMKEYYKKIDQHLSLLEKL